MSLTSIHELDLRPKPGKKYWQCHRDWREEFIYFLLVDRFHDGKKRSSVKGPNRSRGGGDFEQLRRFCGGKLRAITEHLDYIRGLGCTALWLSPIFEANDAPSTDSFNYHGYSIQNYLDVDPRFGTRQDLINLVDAAHDREMRVILDVVINHSGDNWEYAGGPQSYRPTPYPLGSWRRPDRPLPRELRDAEMYHRNGQITNFDAYPEALMGDFFGLKDYNSDETAAGMRLQEIMRRVHCWWIREADIDGFRMDAVKHMPASAVARFCTAVREYSLTLGKHNFYLFGELIAADDDIDAYVGPSTNMDNVHYGLDSVLDFPLFWVLASVIKGMEPPTALYHRYDELRVHALQRGELSRHLVCFLDNHDQVGAEYKRRFGTGAPDPQVVAGAGYLLCALGIPCLYYGTEQGFSGEGAAPEYVRETMFDMQRPDADFLNTQCYIYREIAALARAHQQLPALRFGRMYFRETAAEGEQFSLPQQHPCVLALSRILSDQEVLVAYNTSTTEALRAKVLVDSELHPDGEALRYYYGGRGQVEVQRADSGARFIDLHLQPMQFVVLSR